MEVGTLPNARRVRESSNLICSQCSLNARRRCPHRPHSVVERVYGFIVRKGLISSKCYIKSKVTWLQIADDINISEYSDCIPIIIIIIIWCNREHYARNDEMQLRVSMNLTQIYLTNSRRQYQTHYQVINSFEPSDPLIISSIVQIKCTHCTITSITIHNTRNACIIPSITISSDRNATWLPFLSSF